MIYFTTETEKFISDYLNASGVRKQVIFNEHLYPPFIKNGRAILNRYFKGFEFDSDEADTIINESISKISTNLHFSNLARQKHIVISVLSFVIQ